MALAVVSTVSLARPRRASQELIDSLSLLPRHRRPPSPDSDSDSDSDSEGDDRPRRRQSGPPMEPSGIDLSRPMTATAPQTPIEVIGLLEAKSRHLKGLMAMAAAVWTYQNPQHARARLRFFGLST